MNDRERAKEWIDEISTQEVDRILYFLNLCLSKRDLYHERNELKKEIERLKQELQRKDNNWNELKEFILNHYIVGHTVQNGSLDMIINKMKELEEK